MLMDFLEDHIQVIDAVDSWEDSIRKSASILLKKKYITENYIDAMVKSVHINGSYIVIIPNVAMPHARPEEGVNKSCLSFLKINQPVMYPQDQEVRLVFVLAGNDNEGHIDLISSLADLLEDKQAVNALLQAKTPGDAKNVLKGY